MSSDSTQFLEIEHKFVVESNFDLESFVAGVRALGPVDEKQVQVRDTYFLPSENSNFIYRHRMDEEIQQLTVKSRGRGNEVRTEINLELGALPSQEAAVNAWMQLIGTSNGHVIDKAIWVFEFSDCEVVHYHARYGKKSVVCVEFEAVGAESKAAALATLLKYENQLGFDAEARTRINLFDLLVIAS
ncbi:MAG: CYTH domain-containing protein [Flavobacteriales bacterium]